LIGAAGGLATYNSQQGRFAIEGVNIRRAKEMADQLGVSYQELTKGAIAAQERQLAMSDLMSKPFNMDEKDREFITNLSRMEGGRMIIDVPTGLMEKLGITESQVELGKLTEQQIETLKQNRKAFEDMSPKQIAQDQFTSIKNIEMNVNSLVKQQARGLYTETLGRGGFDLDKQAAPLYKTIEQFAEKNTGFTKDMINSMKGEARDLLRGSLLEGGFEKFNDELKTLLQKYKNQSNTENQTPESKEGLPRKDEGAFLSPQNFNLKSQIDVRFPFGYGQPVAEQQGSYLIPT